MENTTFFCAHCGEEHMLDERVLVSGETLCAACANELTVVCDSCGARIFAADSVSDANHVLCERCFDRYYQRCTNCGRVLPNDEVYYSEDDEPYCACCYDELDRHAAIHDYSYCPELVFHGENARFFGVELEIDGNGKSDCRARQILAAANGEAENLYIKSDGSLDCGMELVTHPMTLDYHMNMMPWAEILDKVIELGYNSHRTSTCGLHVHISREAFGLSMLNQELAVVRLLYFVEKFWPELLRFSRRTERQINRWAARYGMKLSPQEVLDSAKDSRAGRYTAVNLTNAETIEIRIFRGTLKLSTLLATLQMVNAMCDVAILLSDEELQALSWHDFLDRLHEPELIQYLKERNLYKNEPVACEEDA